MKIWNKNICLTSRKTLTILAALLIRCYGTYDYCKPIEQEETTECIKEPVEVWIPTKEDIAYQDSMYSIIQSTQSDIDTIKESIIYILERLDYKDGTYDSIRYVKGSEIDKRRNQ